MAENPSNRAPGQQGFPANPAKPFFPSMVSGGPALFKPTSLMMGKPIFSKQSIPPPQGNQAIPAAPSMNPPTGPPTFVPGQRPPTFNVPGKPTQEIGSPRSPLPKQGGEAPFAQQSDTELMQSGTSQVQGIPPVPANPAGKGAPAPKFGMGFNPSLYAPNLGSSAPKAAFFGGVPPSAVGPAKPFLPRTSAGVAAVVPPKVDLSDEADETRPMEGYSPVRTDNLEHGSAEVIVLGAPKMGVKLELKPPEPVHIKATNEPKPSVVAPKGEGKPAKPEELPPNPLFFAKKSSVEEAKQAAPMFSAQKPFVMPPGPAQFKAQPLNLSKGTPPQLPVGLHPAGQNPEPKNEDATETVDPAKVVPVEVQSGQMPLGASAPKFGVVGKPSMPWQPLSAAVPEGKKEQPFIISPLPGAKPDPRAADAKQGQPLGQMLKPLDPERPSPAPLPSTGGALPPNPVLRLGQSPMLNHASKFGPKPAQGLEQKPGAEPNATSSPVQNSALKFGPPNPTPSPVPNPALKLVQPNTSTSTVPSPEVKFEPKPAQGLVQKPGAESSATPSSVLNSALKFALPNTSESPVPNPALKYEQKPAQGSEQKPSVPKYPFAAAPPRFLQIASPNTNPSAGSNTEASSAVSPAPNSASRPEPSSVPNSAPSSLPKQVPNLSIPAEEIKAPGPMFPLYSKSQEQSLESVHPAQVLRSKNVPPFPVPPELLERLQVSLAQRNSSDGSSPSRSEANLPRAEENTVAEKTGPVPVLASPPWAFKQPVPAEQPSAVKAPEPLQAFPPRQPSQSSVPSVSIPKVPVAPEARAVPPQPVPAPPFMQSGPPPFLNLSKPVQPPPSAVPQSSPPFALNLPKQSVQQAGQSPFPLARPVQENPPTPAFTNTGFNLPSTKPGAMQAPIGKPGGIQAPVGKPAFIAQKPGAQGFPPAPQGEFPKPAAKFLVQQPLLMAFQNNSTQVQCMSCRVMTNKEDIQTDSRNPNNCKVCKNCLLKALRASRPLCCPVCKQMMGQEMEELISGYSSSLL